MPVELREITIHATRPHDPVGYVQFFAGDGANLEQSEQWITGQVPAGLPAMKPIALLQIVTLQRARGLLDDEIEQRRLCCSFGLRICLRACTHAQLLLNVGYHRVRQARLAECRKVLDDDVLP
jgi:hypothetical protein